MRNQSAFFGVKTLQATLVGLLLWYASPAPLQAASLGQDAVMSVPEFAPSSGVFTQTLSLRLTGQKDGSVIRYTLDGSEPTEKSSAFREKIDLSTTTLVRARIFAPDGSKGPVVAQTYTLVGPDVQKFTSNLPLVVIDTFGQIIQHVEKLRASIRFIDATNSRTSLIRPADFDGRGDVWYRGKSSLRYLKRSYGVKLRDESGKPRSASVLGFPKDSDWILYAPYPDKTLLRDVIAYELSNQMGHYTSRTRFVEVFVNEEGGPLTMRNYMGVFVLEEKIKRSTNRVNIAKLGTNDNAEPNITGGYIFKKDHLDEFRNVDPTWDGRPNFGGGNSGLRYGYPTGPGGFPADSHGFQAPVGGSRESARGWEDFRNAQPANPTQQPQQESRSWIDNVRSLFGGDQGRPPSPNEQDRSIRRFEEGRAPRGFREPGVIWDAASGRVITSRSFEEVFYTSRRNEFFYVEPDPGEITPAQRKWLRTYLNDFERALYGSDFRDPQRGYGAYVDRMSFIDHHLMVEITKNIDGFRFSTFYSKDRGGKIQMQPIWDWNLSFGNANGKQGQIPEYWYWPQLDDSQYSYFRRLFEDADFGQHYVDRYAELRASVFSLSNINARIDGHVTELSEAQARNFKRWPILGRRVWPNTFVGATYEEEIAYMKDFIRRRLEWIDRQFVAAPKIAPSLASVKNSGLITLNAAAPKIYYTLDGMDPRLSGGGVAPTAQLAAGPFRLPEGGKLFARAFQGGRWSAPTKR
jgi:hypothetical protein